MNLADVSMPSVGSRRTRVPVAIALAIMLVLSVAACGKDKAPEERLQEALDRGLVELAAGQYPEATKSFQEVVEIDPNNPFGHYNLGVVEMQNNRLQTAEQYFRAALNLSPTLEGALFNLAIIRTPTDPDEAEDLYRRCVEFNEANAGCHLNLGFLLKDNLGRAKDGIAEIKIAAALNPEFANRVPPESDDERATTSTTRP